MTDVVQQVIDRLGSQVPTLAGVEGALELADLMERKVLPQRFPWAFVLPVGEDAEPNAVAVNAMRQRDTETVGVLIVHKHAGSRAGAETRAAIEPVKAAVRTALLGWQPGPEMAPLEFVRARLVGMAGGAAFVQADFRTDHQLAAEVAA